MSRIYLPRVEPVWSAKAVVDNAMIAMQINFDSNVDMICLSKL